MALGFLSAAKDVRAAFGSLSGRSRKISTFNLETWEFNPFSGSPGAGLGGPAKMDFKSCAACVPARHNPTPTPKITHPRATFPLFASPDTLVRPL